MIPENKLLEYHTLLARAELNFATEIDKQDYKRGEYSVQRVKNFRDQLLRDFPIDLHTIVSLWNLARAR